MKVAIIGSFIVDLMARAPHLPEPGETVKGTFFKAGPGGKGSNQAIAAKRAGCDLVYSTKIGEDSFSQIALEAYKQDDLSLEYVFTTNQAPTGCALISVDEQTSQNEIIVVLGACATFNHDDIMRLDKMLNGCEYLLLQMEINEDATETIINLAYNHGVKVILNPAPVQPLAMELYQKLYMVTPNEVEARILTGESCDTIEGCQNAAKVFFDKGVKKVVITLGSRGVFLCDEDGWNTYENYDVKVVDSTGAGDAFNGGLLAGLSRGMSLRSAVQFGNVVSNLAVTRIGTAPAMPTSSEIDAFICEHKVTL